MRKKGQSYHELYIRLTPDQYEFISDFAWQNHESIAEIIRWLVSDLMNAINPKKPYKSKIEEAKKRKEKYGRN